ncbi:Zn-dependent hydrolase, partial [Brevibacillus sp. B_LB10_24]
MQATEKIDGKRIAERLEILSKIGKTAENGVHRLALSAEDKQAQKLVASWMQEAGMAVRQDSFGNLIGRKE